MGNTLVGESDLADWGDFPDAHVDAAAAELRRVTGWHIAPVVTETIKVPVPHSRVRPQELVLPTRELPGAPVTVSDVRYGTTVVTGWEKLSSMLWRRSGWPAGEVSVTLTHGFVACPADLLRYVAQAAAENAQNRSSRVTSFTNGAVQMAFGDAWAVDPTVAAYRIPQGVA